MNLSETLGNFLGLVVILAFIGLVIIFAVAGRSRPGRNLRELLAFTRLRRAAGLAVEEGTRLHVSVGRGEIFDLAGGAALEGFTILERTTRAASISDRPPIATSGTGTVAALSRNTMDEAYQAVGAGSQYNPVSGRLTGPTPFSFAAGVLPIIHDEDVSINILAGHFGSEVALIADASERSGSLMVAGSDDVPAQAVLYAMAQEPLIGEELYAGGAYLSAGPLHAASLHAEDVLRWILILVIPILAIAKLFGFLP